mmetsp:Transcript_101202/g.201043  ORF Transcript_101202/g.201043 Transcript_101202/m.201043 type:complete len:213 (-) Transcript_101202:473-1111(-)
MTFTFGLARTRRLMKWARLHTKRSNWMTYLMASLCNIARSSTMSPTNSRICLRNLSTKKVAKRLASGSHPALLSCTSINFGKYARRRHRECAWKRWHFTTVPSITAMCSFWTLVTKSTFGKEKNLHLSKKITRTSRLKRWKMSAMEKLQLHTTSTITFGSCLEDKPTSKGQMKSLMPRQHLKLSPRYCTRLLMPPGSSTAWRLDVANSKPRC